MPRALIVGNGSLLATFDARLQLRDLYFPYVGMEDHTAYGDVHRFGAWVQGRGFAWSSDPSWEIQPRYKPETLVGDSVLRNDKLGIAITAEDFVHPVHNVLVRRMRMRSTDGTEKHVRLFFHHDFHIYGDKQKDTAFYEPSTNAVIHYRQQRYFLVGGQSSDPVECRMGGMVTPQQSILSGLAGNRSCGINAWSIGKSDYQGLEGTWRDAEDGELSNTVVDQGSVDSTVAIHSLVHPDSETTADLWLCLGKSLEEVVDLQNFVLRETPDRLQRNCHNYWKSWLGKARTDLGTLPSAVQELYRRSLLLIRLHTDNHGGIVAAADADIMAFNKDTYTYVWPRDGAFVAMALDRAGYSEVTERFFEFCTRVQTRDGYLLQKYNPDGSYGSSWHPWYRDGEAQLPIQEDETALVLCALWEHFQCCQDFEFLQRMYEEFIKRAAKFLSEFREPETGLPLPSYDPWEEHRGIFTYTVACTIAGLDAAAKLSAVLGHYNHADRYERAADEIRQALVFHLYDEAQGRFLKKIKRAKGQTTERDATPDAAIAAIWMLNVFSENDPRVVSTMQQLEQTLTLRSGIGGIARYAADRYQAKEGTSSDVPGNPWVITTLWFAQWHVRRARTLADLEVPRRTLSWVAAHASATGVLPEQLHPRTGTPLSVAPLTWSHATFVDTVLAFARKEQKLNIAT